MIYISQGHERGVGIEILVKSLLCLPQSLISNFKLFIYPEDLKSTLESMKLECEVLENSFIVCNTKIYAHWLKETGIPHSTGSLMKALIEAERDKQSILLTMPTSKDQIVDPLRPSRILAGHTEFFRDFYKNNNISMVFHGNELNSLLITDHLSLKDFIDKINTKMIVEKISTTIESYPKTLSVLSSIYLSGINPHNGEGGILGNEDKFVSEAIEELKLRYPDKKIMGPYSGDTMIFHHKNNNSLFVYMYHDQGLGVFKALNKYIGINISIGMPILRMSVDHGTAFEMFGKNRADYSGCLFLLETALKLIKKA